MRVSERVFDVTRDLQGNEEQAAEQASRGVRSHPVGVAAMEVEDCHSAKQDERTV